MKSLQLNIDNLCYLNFNMSEPKEEAEESEAILREPSHVAGAKESKGAE